MADVKFMDISENSNPATTDSILIANSDSGVKRATLGNVGKLFGISHLFEFRKVSVKLNTATNNMYTLTPPNVDGYNFVFWLAPQVSYSQGSAHTDTPTTSRAIFYTTVPEQTVNPNAEVIAFAVYIRAELV